MHSLTSRQVAELTLSAPDPMGALLRAVDWKATPLGTPESWPQSLQSTLSICLNTRFPIAMYWGPEYVLLYNEAWMPIPGNRHPWALGRPAREVWPEIWHIIGPRYDQVMRGEAVSGDNEFFVMQRNGYIEETYFDYTISPVRGEGGRVVGIFNPAIETTCRVIDERRERLLRSVAEGAAAARSPQQACAVSAELLAAGSRDVPFCLIYLVSPDGRHARLAGTAGFPAGSPACPLMLDLSRDDDVWPLATVWSTRRMAVVHQLQKRISGPIPGGAWPEPARSAVVVPLFDAGSAAPLVGFLIVGVNPRRAFDERYRTFLERAAAGVGASMANARSHDQERKELRSRLENIANVAPVAIYEFRVAPDGKRSMPYSTPAIEDIFGITPEEAASDFSRIIALTHPEDLPRLLNGTEQSRRTLQPYHECFRFRHPRKGEVWVEFHSRAEPQADGTVVWYGYFHDVTQLKRIQQQLLQADAQKNQFLAMLGHELRNPLAPITSALAVLKGLDLQDERARRLVQMLERHSRYLIRLVDDLLDVARITQGRIALRKSSAEMGELVHRAVETVSTAFAERRHELRLVPPAECIRLEVDETRIVQVISNVLGNAARYTDPGGRVEVAWHRQAGEAVLRVTDSGVGIDPALLPHVFDLFQQGARASHQAQEGLGIGLAVVQRLVELHGGTVRAHSAGAHQGSLFEIRLPISETKAAPAANEGEAAVPSLHRLLLVDDNRDAADSLSCLLRSLGYSTRAVYSGLEAIEAAREHPPHAVLLDIRMPDLNGYETARRLRALPGLGGVVMIALTGYVAGSDGEESPESPATVFDHYLLKPVDVPALQAILRYHAEQALIRPVRIARRSALGVPFSVSQAGDCGSTQRP